MAVERYERQKLLGKGLMSVVWLAQDTFTQQPVALKIMTTIGEDDRRNQKAQERFLREIEIARSLQHPHILPILNYGYMDFEDDRSEHLSEARRGSVVDARNKEDDRSVPFLVSPYIREGSLAELIKEGPPWKFWTLQQTADAIVQAAESLWYLHTRTPQIVHQDVKPGNFLFRSVNTPQRIVHLYLCDFGISRWLQSSFTMASELLGTFAYMAPEQVERRIDCASDQYTLAVMACHLLTGKLPIQASTNEEYADAHLHDKPIPPSTLNPERIGSSEIDDVILRALEKSPEQRFPTILRFAQTLQRAIMRQVQARAAAKTERFDPLLTKTAYPPGEQDKLLSIPARKYIKPAIQPLRVEPAIPIALDPLDTGDEQVLDEPLPVKPQKVIGLSGRGEEGVHALLPLKLLARWELPARPRIACWSHNGNCLACALYGHAPLIVSKDGRMQEVQTRHAAQATSICWSPDDHVLAIASQSEIRFWNVETRLELPLVLHCSARTIDALDWSISRRLAIWVENQVVIYPLTHALLTAQQPPLPQILPTGSMRSGNVGVLRWSPDGSLLAAGASNGAVICWDMRRQAALWQVAEPGRKVNSISWSADNTLLAAAFSDNRVMGWDVRARDKALLWTKLPAMPRMLSISTNGRIALASGEKCLLFGFPGESFPSTMFPGQLLAAWSPTDPELAMLDENRETFLVVWRE